MFKEKIDTMSGHWILAKLGKKVLRPGGKNLTLKMLSLLNINTNDSIIEFAPGLGYTAKLTLAKNPKSYTGVDSDEEAVLFLQKKIKNTQALFINKNASQTQLPDEVATKIYGEAMLTMQANHRKEEIIREAHRLLAPGGLYAIHELVLFPDSLDEESKKTIQYELAESMKVNARPLTIAEWKDTLESQGFRIKQIEKAPMHLLQAGRIISDEGFLGFLGIVKKLILNPDIKKRVLQMRKTFKKYENHLEAIVIISEKIN